MTKIKGAGGGVGGSSFSGSVDGGAKADSTETSGGGLKVDVDVDIDVDAGGLLDGLADVGRSFREAVGDADRAIDQAVDDLKGGVKQMERTVDESVDRFVDRGLESLHEELREVVDATDPLMQKALEFDKKLTDSFNEVYGAGTHQTLAQTAQEVLSDPDAALDRAAHYVEKYLSPGQSRERLYEGVTDAATVLNEVAVVVAEEVILPHADGLRSASQAMNQVLDDVGIRDIADNPLVSFAMNTPLVLVYPPLALLRGVTGIAAAGEGVADAAQWVSDNQDNVRDMVTCLSPKALSTAMDEIPPGGEFKLSGKFSASVYAGLGVGLSSGGEIHIKRDEKDPEKYTVTLGAGAAAKVGLGEKLQGTGVDISVGEGLNGAFVLELKGKEGLEAFKKAMFASGSGLAADVQLLADPNVDFKGVSVKAEKGLSAKVFEYLEIEHKIEPKVSLLDDKTVLEFAGSTTIKGNANPLPISFQAPEAHDAVSRAFLDATDSLETPLGPLPTDVRRAIYEAGGHVISGGVQGSASITAKLEIPDRIDHAITAEDMLRPGTKLEVEIKGVAGARRDQIEMSAKASLDVYAINQALDIAPHDLAAQFASGAMTLDGFATLCREKGLDPDKFLVAEIEVKHVHNGGAHIGLADCEVSLDLPVPTTLYKANLSLSDGLRPQMSADEVEDRTRRAFEGLPSPEATAARRDVAEATALHQDAHRRRLQM